MKKYVVISGSLSAHCCFEASVVEEEAGSSLSSPSVCECFSVDMADKIARLLNDEEEGINKKRLRDVSLLLYILGARRD